MIRGRARKGPRRAWFNDPNPDDENQRESHQSDVNLANSGSGKCLQSRKMKTGDLWVVFGGRRSGLEEMLCWDARGIRTQTETLWATRNSLGREAEKDMVPVTSLGLWLSVEALKRDEGARKGVGWQERFRGVEGYSTATPR